MKKKISVITLIPRSGRFYARQVRDLFGDRLQVAAYSTKDQSVEKIAPSDLYLLSTDAFKEAEEVRRYIPEGSQVVEIQLTYPLEVIRRLKEIPKERDSFCQRDAADGQRGYHTAGTKGGESASVHSLWAGFSDSGRG